MNGASWSVGTELLGVSDGGGYQYPNVLGTKTWSPTAIGAFSVPEFVGVRKSVCATKLPVETS